ncbi:MAG: hypothetical protein U1D35_19150 [Paracoccaceae bacterium]|nr:hypothetical protein [Paracoccaceae bacterium]
MESAEALSMLDQCRQRPAVVVARFTAINSPLLQRVTPTCVVFSLFADGFDTLQLVSRLQDMGYRGRVFALCPPLPNRMMVLAELRNAAPGLRIELLTRIFFAPPPLAARR